MSQSIKKNFLYSSILTVSNYLFPLIVFPYVSRVLGVTNIGICNFVDSIVNYFMLFSMMGISIMGIREISATKTDRRVMSRTFFSLLVLNGIFTLLATAGLLCVAFFVPSLTTYRELVLVSVVKLLGNFMLIEWFFKGLEDFRYITNRSILVKMAYVACVFLFVQERQDYIVYYVLTVLVVVVNALFNVCHAWGKLHFTTEGINVRKPLKPFLYLGAYMLLTSMYTSFNVMYLGLVQGPDEVGYYTTATKLYTIILSFFTAFTGVMLPRMSSLLADKRMDEFRQLISKSTSLLVSLSIPTVLVATIFCPQIIHLLAGGEFDAAIMPARIVMPLLFVIGYEQILVIQVMMPTKCDRVIFRNAVIGAFVGIALNLLFVGRYGAMGSALVWLGAELVVLSLSQHHVGRQLQLRYPLASTLKHLLAYMPLVLVCLALQYYGGGSYGCLTVALATSATYFLVIQFYVLPNAELQQLVSSLLRKIHLIH